MKEPLELEKIHETRKTWTNITKVVDHTTAKVALISEEDRIKIRLIEKWISEKYMEDYYYPIIQKILNKYPEKEEKAINIVLKINSKSLWENQKELLIWLKDLFSYYEKTIEILLNHCDEFLKFGWNNMYLTAQAYEIFWKLWIEKANEILKLNPEYENNDDFIERLLNFISFMPPQILQKIEDIEMLQNLIKLKKEEFIVGLYHNYWLDSIKIINLFDKETSFKKEDVLDSENSMEDIIKLYQDTNRNILQENKKYIHLLQKIYIQEPPEIIEIFEETTEKITYEQLGIFEMLSKNWLYYSVLLSINKRNVKITDILKNIDKKTVAILLKI